MTLTTTCSSSPSFDGAVRTRAPLVGLLLSSSNLHLQNALENYDAAIMHTPLAPSLCEMRVQLHATAFELAATFSLPVGYVAANWITSNSPLCFSSTNRFARSMSAHAESSAVALNRFHALLCSRLDAVLAQRAHVDSGGAPHAARPSRARFERVYERVARHVTTLEPSRQQQQQQQQQQATIAANARRKPSAEKLSCGFDASLTHGYIQLSAQRKNACKTVQSLYRTAVAAARFTRAANYYAEFEVADVADGGLLVGVAQPTNTSLNGLLGEAAGAAAFHSSGFFVCDNEWKQMGCAFGNGDVVGLLVCVNDCCFGLASLELSTTNSCMSPSEPTTCSGCCSTGCGTCSGKCACSISVFVNGVAKGTLRGVACFAGASFATCLYRRTQSVGLRCCAVEWRYFAAAAAVGNGDGDCIRLNAACHSRRCASGSGVTTDGDGDDEADEKVADGGSDLCAVTSSVLTP